MRGDREITVKRLFNAKEIAANGNATSGPIPLDNIAQSGLFSLQIALTGDGTAKVEYQLCCEEQPTNFLEPASASDIVTGFTKTSGPGSDGKAIYSFQPELAKTMKIKVTETGTSDSITVTIDLNTQ